MDNTASVKSLEKALTAMLVSVPGGPYVVAISPAPPAKCTLTDDGRTLLVKAASKGELAIVEGFVRGFAIANEDVTAAFHWACQEGHTPVAKVLAAYPGFDAVATLCSGNTFDRTCHYGRVETAEWLIREFNLVAVVDENKAFELFERAVFDNKSIAELLWREFKISPGRIRARGNWLFHKLCGEGRTSMATWIKEIAGITRDDVLNVTYGDSSFVVACRNGHLDTAQWLFIGFAMTLADTQAENKLAVRVACKNEHPYVVHWLINLEIH